LKSVETSYADMAKVVKASVSRGVDKMLDSPIPEALALGMFLEDLYKMRFVARSEVVKRVKELLRSVEEDSEQHRRLVEIRKKFCERREALSLLAEFFETAAGIPEMEDMALANYAIIRVLLAQCDPRWTSLDSDKKAEILAPLYMALYHLKTYEETRQQPHLRSAATLAIEALNMLEDVFGEQVEDGGS